MGTCGRVGFGYGIGNGRTVFLWRVSTRGACTCATKRCVWPEQDGATTGNGNGHESG